MIAPQFDSLIKRELCPTTAQGDFFSFVFFNPHFSFQFYEVSIIKKQLLSSISKIDSCKLRLVISCMWLSHLLRLPAMRIQFHIWSNPLYKCCLCKCVSAEVYDLQRYTSSWQFTGRALPLERKSLSLSHL